jgi:hypothetical protein
VKDFDKEEIGESPNMILFFVKQNTGNLIYNPMKKYYQKKGVPCQFLTSFNPRKDGGNLSKISNVVTQMMNKLGGNLWGVQ